MKHKCPICKKVVKTSSGKQPDHAEFLPFCSERCKLVDLGAWLDAEYKIPARNPDASADDKSDAR